MRACVNDVKKSCMHIVFICFVGKVRFQTQEVGSTSPTLTTKFNMVTPFIKSGHRFSNKLSISISVRLHLIKSLTHIELSNLYHCSICCGICMPKFNMAVQYKSCDCCSNTFSINISVRLHATDNKR